MTPKRPTRPKRARKAKPKPTIPAWARLPDTFEAIERGERLEPIPEHPARLLPVKYPSQKEP